MWTFRVFRFKKTLNTQVFGSNFPAGQTRDRSFQLMKHSQLPTSQCSVHKNYTWSKYQAASQGTRVFDQGCGD